MTVEERWRRTRTRPLGGIRRLFEGICLLKKKFIFFLFYFCEFEFCCESNFTAGQEDDCRAEINREKKIF